MQDFKKLEVWKLSFEFGKKVYKITASFPKEEIYSITSQLRRAALSISANIAEGTGRSSDKDFVRFLYIAMGSLKESENFILMSKDFNYITPQQFEELFIQTQVIGIKLSNLIKSIKVSIKNKSKLPNSGEALKNAKQQARSHKLPENKREATSNKLSNG